ncbi:MAG TPA: cyclic beta 1-2 glucan synthetase, partial [Burkholderiaceae bacterium]|nr:cyclic beta 1-2 glucan synthetase [Burkholderiaceae bacterium]
MILQHLSASLRSTKQHFFQAALSLIFLPYDAFVSLDAIFRALWRMLISRRNLLEWAPSNQIDSQAGDRLINSFRRMWFAPTLAMASIMILLASHPIALIAAAPFLLAWLIAPVIAWRISQPQMRVEVRLHDGQAIFLYRLARKIWAYYETLVGPEDNWLPPDNIQERPIAVVAHRTSPTNIGLALLANLSAYDFAYISGGQLLERSSNTLRTMAAMERHRGHFYNWYDTQTLKPLLPMYISTVDSGNLAGHLLTLRPGLLMLIDQPIINPRLISGIDDTFKVFQDLAGATSQMQLAQFQVLLDSAHVARPTTLSACHACLQQLVAGAENLVTGIDQKESFHLAWWAAALLRQCRAMYDELLFLAPWSSWMGSLGENLNLAKLDSIPTLRALVELETYWLDENAKALPEDTLKSGNEEVQGVGEMLALGSLRATARIKEIENLALQAAEFAQMDCGFLHDNATHLMTIGYAVAEQRCDSSCYDLLASEARLCTFVMIAQGQLPQESWFALGRQLT